MSTTILPFGTIIYVATVDMYGHVGRENHPERNDKNRVGFVTGCFVLDAAENEEYEPEPWAIVEESPDLEVYYTVVFPNGDLRTLLSWEVELASKDWEPTQAR